jgi:hypothetical protein
MLQLGLLTFAKHDNKQPPCAAALLLPLAGWVALAVAVILSTIKLTWWWGTSKKHNYVRLNQVCAHHSTTSLLSFHAFEQCC